MLTWDEEKELELGNFGLSSVQQACTVKCKRDVKLAEHGQIYFLYTIVDKCTPGMMPGTLDINISVHQC